LNLDFCSLFSDFYFFLIFSDLISPCFFLMYFFSNYYVPMLFFLDPMLLCSN
jgi:hypothetical protein